jgi:hypothetical protein
MDPATSSNALARVLSISMRPSSSDPEVLPRMEERVAIIADALRAVDDLADRLAGTGA